MRHWVDEAEVIAKLAGRSSNVDSSVLVDVGAHHGDVTALFLNMGWSVVAYEPDPTNREKFLQRVALGPRVQLSEAAVSDKPAPSASLFTSGTSSGISTLSAFHESHEPTVRVDVVTLAEDLRRREVAKVDFLKIDIEGFDFFALKGFDWHYKPRFVLYEFEDRKTGPLGYTLADSSAYMATLGYKLVYSVWEPIVEYGMRHKWRGLFLEQSSDTTECWGNVLCFRDGTDALRCIREFAPRSQREALLKAGRFE